MDYCRIYLVLLFLFFFTDKAFTQESAIVPEGKMIMIDGKIDSTEWRDAISFNSSDSVEIYLKTSSDFLLIAIESKKWSNIYTDLFIQDGARIIDFHSSAKLGERSLKKNRWTDWYWWNNTGWVANVSRVNSFDQKTFLFEKSREYQIKKALFKEKRVSIFIEISKMNSYHDQSIRFPNKATISQHKKWLDISW